MVGKLVLEFSESSMEGDVPVDTASSAEAVSKKQGPAGTLLERGNARELISTSCVTWRNVFRTVTFHIGIAAVI